MTLNTSPSFFLSETLPGGWHRRAGFDIEHRPPYRQFTESTKTPRGSRCHRVHAHVRGMFPKKKKRKKGWCNGFKQRPVRVALQQCKHGLALATEWHAIKVIDSRLQLQARGPSLEDSTQTESLCSDVFSMERLSSNDTPDKHTRSLLPNHYEVETASALVGDPEQFRILVLP